MIAVDDSPAEVIDLFFQVLVDITTEPYHYELTPSALTVELAGKQIHSETISLPQTNEKTLLHCNEK